jgi:hypothetical protein
MSGFGKYLKTDVLIIGKAVLNSLEIRDWMVTIR